MIFRRLWHSIWERGSQCLLEIRGGKVRGRHWQTCESTQSISFESISIRPPKVATAFGG
jgi:hypothetical protein